MYLSTLWDMEFPSVTLPREVLLWNETYTVADHVPGYVSHSGNILTLQWYIVCSFEKSFLIGKKVYHKVKISRWTSNQAVEEVDYQLKEGMTYIVDAHGNFVTIASLYKWQKLIDIIWKVPLFWTHFFLSVAHSGQTYVLDENLGIKKDSRGRDIRNIFKTLKDEGKELIFCEVFEYGKWVTNTVLKNGFTPLTDTDGKEVICIKKYDFTQGKIILEVENEDGRVWTVEIKK